MIHGWYISNNAIPFLSFLILGFRIHMEYLFYCVVYLKVWGTIREVFVANVVDATLTNHGVFTQLYAHDVEVASTRYRRFNGNPSPFNSDTDNP
jgi:hypothetical protein